MTATINNFLTASKRTRRKRILVGGEGVEMAEEEANMVTKLYKLATHRAAKRYLRN